MDVRLLPQMGRSIAGANENSDPSEYNQGALGIHRVARCSACFLGLAMPTRPPQWYASRRQFPVTKAPSEADSDLSAGQIRLRHGTSLWLMTTESVSSKTAKAGDRVRLQVVGGVKVGDLVVIANKAPAFGTITEVKKPGLAWHPGYITMRLESITLANGQEVPLEPSPVTELGESNQPTQNDVRDAMQSTGGLYLVYFPFSFLEHGEQAVQPRGTVVQATIQGDTILERASIESSQPARPKRDEASASLTIYYPEFAPKGSLTVWCGAAKSERYAMGID